jgi:hypothetical protein
MHHLVLTNIFFCRRIFWLGDLNYRIKVPYGRAHGLVAAMDWSQLAEKDQVPQESLPSLLLLELINESASEFACFS